MMSAQDCGGTETAMSTTISAGRTPGSMNLSGDFSSSTALADLADVCSIGLKDADDTMFACCNIELKTRAKDSRSDGDAPMSSSSYTLSSRPEGRGRRRTEGVGGGESGEESVSEDSPLSEDSVSDGECEGECPLPAPTSLQLLGEECEGECDGEGEMSSMSEESEDSPEEEASVLSEESPESEDSVSDGEGLPPADGRLL